MGFPERPTTQGVGFFKLILAGLVAATVASATVTVLLAAEVISLGSFHVALN
jgi:hypothetical protein